jgi:hypothetical protein
MNLLRGIVGALLLIVVVGILPIAWITRDGLGPNSVETTGVQAIVRCLTNFWVGPIILILLLIEVLLYRLERPQK